MSPIIELNFGKLSSQNIGKIAETRTEVADTIPRVFVEQYHKCGDKKMAVVQKEIGIWKPYTWKEQHEIVKYFARH